MPIASTHPHPLWHSPDRVRRQGTVVALYSTADANAGAGHSLVLTARELGDSGIAATVIAVDGYFARELMWARVDTTVLRRGPGESWRLRRTLRAIGVRLLIVGSARDERIAAFATFGLMTKVLRLKLDGLDHETWRPDAKEFAQLVGRELGPMRTA